MSRRKVRLLSLVLDERVNTNMSQFALAEPGIWLDVPSQGGFIKYSNISFASFVSWKYVKTTTTGLCFLLLYHLERCCY